MTEKITLHELSKILALKFEKIRKTNNISYVAMNKEFSERWECSEGAVKQYLDQTFKGGIHFSRICESNKENNNFKGTQESFSAIKLHVTRISEIIEFIKPEKENRNDIYTLLNKINPNYFK
jgi:hypothetical protein